MLQTSFLFAQPPARIITFDQLEKLKVRQTVAWTNADSSREAMEIVQMRIPVDDEIKQLTRTYMRQNYRRSSIWVDPRMIVIHSMDLGDLRNSLEKSSFLDRRMPKAWKTQVKAGVLPSGAHFVIDRDGKIYCLTPPLTSDDETLEFAEVSYSQGEHYWMIRRHLDCNPMALGIENLTPKNGSYDDLTKEQITANARLIRWLLWMEKGKLDHIVSHHQFNDRNQFTNMLNEFKLELAQPIYRAWTRKDVGDKVMEKILEEVREKGWVVKDRF